MYGLVGFSCYLFLVNLFYKMIKDEIVPYFVNNNVSLSGKLVRTGLTVSV